MINSQVLAAAIAVLRTADPEITASGLSAALETAQSCTQQQQPRKMITLREFAQLAKISMPTVARIVKRGQLRTVKVGLRNVRIPAAEVDRYLSGNL